MDQIYFPGVQEFSPEVQEALIQIQENLGIQIRARCCMPEFSVASICGWRHRPIRASLKGTLPGLSADTTRQVYTDALNAWNKVCNTGLVWTDDWANANIKASVGKIDGRSGTLAYSYLIQCGGGSTQNTQLTQLFDSSEGWTYDWALEVIEHEVGHALGLPHDVNKAALMYPYSHSGKVIMPTQFEIAKVVPLYGPPVTSSIPDQPVVIIGGTLVMPDGTVVGIDAGNQFTYAGKVYKLKVSQ